MNSVNLLGRITQDLNIRYSTGGMAILKFIIAIDRQTKEKATDFINCIAFGKTAEFINSYFSKGRAIAINGHIQTGSYENNEGKKVYTTEVVCDKVYFADSKRAESGNTPSQKTYTDTSGFGGGNGFYPMDEDDDLPFN